MRRKIFQFHIRLSFFKHNFVADKNVSGLSIRLTSSYGKGKSLLNIITRAQLESKSRSSNYFATEITNRKRNSRRLIKLHIFIPSHLELSVCLAAAKLTDKNHFPNE